MKLNGIEFSPRGSNKKYPQLDDLDWVLKKLQTQSITSLAKELGVPQNSIRWRLFKWCSPEQIAGIFKERAFHKRAVGKRKPKKEIQ